MAEIDDSRAAGILKRERTVLFEIHLSLIQNRSFLCLYIETCFVTNGSIDLFGFVFAEISKCVLPRNEEVCNRPGNELKMRFPMLSFVLVDKRKMLRRRYRRVDTSTDGMPNSSSALSAGPSWQASTTSKAPQHPKQFRVVPYLNVDGLFCFRMLDDWIDPSRAPNASMPSTEYRRTTQCRFRCSAAN